MIRDRIYDLFFLAFLLAVIAGVSQLLAPFSGALLAALVCAIMFYPIYEALRRWFPWVHPSAAALSADILVLIIFVAPMILLTWAIVRESSFLGSVLRQSNLTLNEWRRGEATVSAPWMGHLQRVLRKGVGMTPLQFQVNVVGRVTQALETISEWGTYAAQRAAYFFLGLAGMLFTLFFLFRDGDEWLAFIRDLIPMNRKDKEHLMTRIHDTVIGVARGWLLTGLLQGVTATLVYWIVGIHGAVLFGALTALFGLVPGIGTIGIWVPVSIFLLAQGLYWKSAFVLVTGALIVVGFIDSIVRPYLVGERVELPLFVLFFALLGGVAVWGAKGIIIGPTLAAITPVLLDIYRDRYLRTEHNEK
jgi:predicted PurR-regulated permease PerM